MKSFAKFFSIKKTPKTVKTNSQDCVDKMLENEKKIKNFEKENQDIMSDPNYVDKMQALMIPDVCEKGIHVRKIVVSRGGIFLPFDKLTKEPIKFLQFRNYFRIAYFRMVWVPNATDIPGNINMGIADCRRVENKIISMKSCKAADMKMFTYQQEVFVSNDEFKHFKIVIDCTDARNSYTDDFKLGTVYVFWILNLTNSPTQFNKCDSTIITMPKTDMPKAESFMKHKGILNRDDSIANMINAYKCNNTDKIKFIDEEETKNNNEQENIINKGKEIVKHKDEYKEIIYDDTFLDTINKMIDNANKLENPRCSVSGIKDISYIESERIKTSKDDKDRLIIANTDIECKEEIIKMIKEKIQKDYMESINSNILDKEDLTLNNEITKKKQAIDKKESSMNNDNILKDKGKNKVEDEFVDRFEEFR